MPHGGQGDRGAFPPRPPPRSRCSEKRRTRLCTPRSLPSLTFPDPSKSRRRLNSLPGISTSHTQSPFLQLSPLYHFQRNHFRRRISCLETLSLQKRTLTLTPPLLSLSSWPAFLLPLQLLVASPSHRRRRRGRTFPPLLTIAARPALSEDNESVISSLLERPPKVAVLFPFGADALFSTKTNGRGENVPLSQRI